MTLKRLREGNSIPAPKDPRPVYMEDMNGLIDKVNEKDSDEVEQLVEIYKKLAGDNPALDLNKAQSKATLLRAIADVKPQLKDLTKLEADTCTAADNYGFIDVIEADYDNYLYVIVAGDKRADYVPGDTTIIRAEEGYGFSDILTIESSELINGNTKITFSEAVVILEDEFGDEEIQNKNIRVGANSALGRNTTASGYYSHSEGYNTTASGDYSHAEGEDTTAEGQSSHAEGKNTIASGSDSHSEGYGTTASGNSSHAEGTSTTASGVYSHAEGQNTIAQEQSSHSEGRNTTASGSYSHAEGKDTTASGISSHAGGFGDSSANKPEASGRATFVHQEVTSGQGIRQAAGDNSAILGGKNNRTVAAAERSVVLGGDSQNATMPDTVYLPQLKLKPSTLPTGLGASDSGLILFDSADSILKCWNGTEWKALFT